MASGPNARRGERSVLRSWGMAPVTRTAPMVRRAVMRSCSDSIAQLAAALAKAQMELVNPVKSLTAVIDRWGIGQEGQSYRYAPLSAGLEIVRKTLCKHELVVIQTTHLDS